MFCMKCGAQIEGQPKFCHKCGQPVEQTAGRPTQAPPYSPSPTAIAPPQMNAPGRRTLPSVWPRRLLTCGALVSVVALACGVLFSLLYLWLGLHRTNQLARIVPADTVAYATISPSLLQLSQLRSAARLGDNMAVFAPLLLLPGVEEAGGRLQRDLPLDQIEIDPGRDILPWIGREVSLAVLDTNRLAEPGAQVQLVSLSSQPTPSYTCPPVVLAATTRNPAASNAFLEKLRYQLEGEGVHFDTTDYRNVIISEIISPTAVSLAYATVNELVLLATSLDALEHAIDQAMGSAGGTTLYDNRAFQNALSGLPSNRLGYLYLDTSSFQEMGIGDSAAETVLLGSLHAVERIGVSFSLSGGGIRLDYLLHYDTNALSREEERWLQTSANSRRLAGQTPANVFLFSSGYDLPQAWNAFVSRLDREVVRDLREMEEELGVRMSRLFDHWGENEYALILFDESGAIFEIFSFILLAEVEDQDYLSKELDRSFGFLAREADLDFYEDSINRVPFWVVEDRWTNRALGFGFLEDTLILADSYEALRRVTRTGQNTLADAPLYQQATKSLPAGSRSHFYIDVQQAMHIMESSMDTAELRQYEREIRPYLQSIRAISGAMQHMDSNGTMHGAIYVVTD
jgi:hypothetical protein